MRYDPHQNLISPAFASASLWRLLAGILLTTALFLVLSMLYGWLGMRFLPAAAWGTDGYGIQEATTTWGALANLYAFVPLVLALAAILPLVHRRDLSSLIGPAAVASAQARRVILYMLGVYIAASVVQLGQSIELTPRMSFAEWLPILPLTLLGLIIQTSAEELVFRGYLQS